MKRASRTIFIGLATGIVMPFPLFGVGMSLIPVCKHVRDRGLGNIRLRQLSADGRLSQALINCRGGLLELHLKRKLSVLVAA